MMVNSADVTDPATGGFGLTVPIDSVESINFYQASFLAEYGRYSAGLVSVETRRGAEEWKWELNDPLPEFYIRSWHLRGLRTATPRLNFEGPIIPGSCTSRKASNTTVRKTPVFTLPFPLNQKKETRIQLVQSGGLDQFRQEPGHSHNPRRSAAAGLRKSELLQS